MFLVINITIRQEIEFVCERDLFDLQVRISVVNDHVVQVEDIGVVLEEENFTCKFLSFVYVFAKSVLVI